MKRKILCLILLLPLCTFAQKTVNLKSLLQDMTDFDAVAKWPGPVYKEMQTSSYDRKSISPGKPGWFANDDRSQYIREDVVDGRKEIVMLDVDGPGAIVRFWLTTFKRNGNIRIYFDGQTTPELTIPAYDLMQSGLDLGKALLQPHSSYEPKEKGGNTLYLPMPYAKHCKITFEDLDKDFQPRYYQVNYRSYPAGTDVETFKLSQVTELKDLINTTNNQLLNPDSKTIAGFGTVRAALLPGKATSPVLLKGPGAIRLVEIKVDTEKPQDYAQALRSVVLKIAFDGEETVWCPVGDLSGAGVGGKALQSWYRTVDADGKIILRFVMPFEKSAKINLENLGDVKVATSLKVAGGKWAWDANSMYFHADWKNEDNVPIKQSEKDKPTDWELTGIKGKGVFIGDALAVYNHSHKWYGEGDQKYWVDGEQFPSEFGTGTEDYYNTSWAPVVLYQTPFANAPRADNPDSYGYNTFTRTRNLDAVPFAKSFSYTLETLGWENNASDFAPTTYWYGVKGAKSNLSNKHIKPGKLPQ